MRLLTDAWRDLVAHRGKSLLSAISLFIAVLSIVGVSAAAAVSQDAIVATSEQESGRAVTVEATVSGFTLDPARYAALDHALSQRVGALAGGAWAVVADADTTVGVAGALSNHTAVQSVKLVGGQLDRIRRLPLVTGRYLEEREPVYPGAVEVNESAMTQLGPVGSQLRVALDAYRPPISFTVVGVIADGLAAPAIYVAFGSWVRFDPTLGGSTSLRIDVHSPAASEQAIRAALTTAIADAGMPAAAQVSRRDRADEQRLSLSSAQRAFMAVSAITILVSIVGMTNIGLASVRERSRELSVRRAIGYSQRRIFAVVMSSSLLIGVIVACLAVTLAFVAVAGVLPRLIGNRLIEVPRFPWGAASLGLIASSAASLLGGLAPALAASRAQIATALR